MRPSRRRAVLVMVATVVLASCQPMQPWRSELASGDATGADSIVVGASEGVISPDGTKVAFVTTAGDLGPTDTNRARDVYLRDLASGETTLISVNEAGTDSGRGGSRLPRFSADGSTLAFASSAKDLTSDDLTPPGGSTSTEHVFLYDITTGETTWASTLLLYTDGYQSITTIQISPDGNRCLYTFSEDSGIFLFDRGTGLAREVTGSSTNNIDWAPHDVSLSPDATKVVFRTWHSYQDPKDTNGESDVYVVDLVTNTRSLVSVNAAGTASGNWYGSYGPSFSPDSTKVVFWSYASDLVPVDANAQETDIFVRDLTTNVTTLVSVDANGGGTNGGSQDGVFTSDGTGVVFTSWATDLGPTDANGKSDVYHRDLVTGTTTLVSVNAEGTDSANGASRAVRGALAGGRVPFVSTADDLGPGDTNGVEDLYARNLAAGFTTLVTADASATDSAQGTTVLTSPLSVSADGRRVAVVTTASDLGSTDTNGVSDVYVATLNAADLAVAAEGAPEPVASGATLTYVVEVTNAGPDAGDDLTAAIVLPEGTEFSAVSTTAGSCDPPESANPRLVVCRFGAGSLGAVATITVDAHVSAPSGTSLSAVAAVSSSTVDDGPGDNTITVETTVA